MSSGSASASAHVESPDRIRSRELAAGVQEVLSADLSEDNQAELVVIERRIDSLNKEIEKRVQVTPVASSEDAGDNKTAMLGSCLSTTASTVLGMRLIQEPFSKRAVCKVCDRLRRGAYILGARYTLPEGDKRERHHPEVWPLEQVHGLSTLH